MLSKTSKYALKAVLYLAVNSDENVRIMAKDIGKPINVPKAYVAKILQELAKHDIVSSVRGPHGGFYLTTENKKRSLIDIVHLIDGRDRLNSCLLSVKDCDEKNPCPFHNLLGSVKNDFQKKLKETTINDLVLDIQQNKSAIPL